MLLHYLDARVHATKLRSKLTGRLCVGVRAFGRTSWWVVQLGPKPTTEFCDALPAEFDVGVAVDPQTASWILGREKSPGPLNLMTGETTLWSSFVKHYLEHNDVVGIRLRR